MLSKRILVPKLKIFNKQIDAYMSTSHQKQWRSPERERNRKEALCDQRSSFFHFHGSHQVYTAHLQIPCHQPLSSPKSPRPLPPRSCPPLLPSAPHFHSLPPAPPPRAKAPSVLEPRPRSCTKFRARSNRPGPAELDHLPRSAADHRPALSKFLLPMVPASGLPASFAGAGARRLLTLPLPTLPHHHRSA